MDTSEGQFQRIDVDDEAGKLTGVDEEDFLIRVPRTIAVQD